MNGIRIYAQKIDDKIICASRLLVNFTADDFSTEYNATARADMAYTDFRFRGKIYDVVSVRFASTNDSIRRSVIVRSRCGCQYLQLCRKGTAAETQFVPVYIVFAYTRFIHCKQICNIHSEIASIYRVKKRNRTESSCLLFGRLM